MSVSVRTSNTTINPSFYESAKGIKYYSTEVMEPVTYNIEFSPDGGNNVAQMQAVFEQCTKDGIEVSINYSLKKDRYGNQVFVVYDIKPVKLASKP